MRTTSSLEALNSVIQRSFPAQTNIFKFVESLKLYEARKTTDLYQLSLRNTPSRKLERKRTADREREIKIQYFTRLLKDGEITVTTFLKSMSAKDILPPIGT